MGLPVDFEAGRQRRAIPHAPRSGAQRESREAARADVFRFIEVEYNRTRLRKHPEFGYLTHSEPEPG
ncbi:hypothetical protein ACFU93_41490 [Streptomyces sp. NPDC057611]|uniref:hypothetical protein n=1 Tax=Streptomyces sp. NPDC057611 TaxID=3346182 RepID=UPI003696E012